MRTSRKGGASVTDKFMICRQIEREKLFWEKVFPLKKKGDKNDPRTDSSDRSADPASASDRDPWSGHVSKNGAPFDVARQKSILALNKAMQGNQKIFLVTQKDSRIEHPKKEDLYTLIPVSELLNGKQESLC